MSPAPLPSISVHNRQRRISVDLDGLRIFAQDALRLCALEKGHGLTSISHIDVLLVSDRRIARLHRDFMRIDGPTDVITFQHGEIFISVDTAKRQARQYRSALGKELRLYLVHGLLHLHGFDDQTAAARARMNRVQERIAWRAPRRRCPV